MPPKAKTASPPKAKAKPPTRKSPPPADAVILYPDIDVMHCYQAGPGRSKGIGPVSGAQAKRLLKWETEPDYRLRMEAEGNSTGDVTQGAKKIAGYGEEFLFKNVAGHKVNCWANNGNRPFTEKHAYEVAQDILNGNWRLNLENVIISRTGKIQSGQHRLIGLVLACELWASDPKYRKYWKTEPVIETLIAVGGSEDPDVIQTIDNVRPRALSDIFFTSPIFQGLSSYDRGECSRYMDQAVDLLWTRTRAGGDKDSLVYQTHSSSLEFFDRHPKLKPAVKLIFDVNKNRELLDHGLYGGHASAMLYLMGASATDPVAYQKAPSEESINWKHWDKAVEFWKALASGADSMAPVIMAIGELADPDSVSGAGRVVEKCIVLTKAWHGFLKGEDLSKVSMSPEYGYKDDKRVLIECPVVGGIDQGPKIRKSDGPTEDEVEQAKAQERAKKIAEKQETINKAKQPPTPKPSPSDVRLEEILARPLVRRSPDGKTVIQERNPMTPPPRPKLGNTNGMLASVPKPRPVEEPVGPGFKPKT